MKKSNKCFIMALTAAISLNFANSAFAAPTQEEINALKTEIAELSKLLKVEQNKDKFQEKKEKRDKLWEFKGDARFKYSNLGSSSKTTERFRITMDHPVGDDMNFHMRWNVMDDNEFGLTSNRADNLYSANGSYRYADFSGSDNNWISDAYIEMYDALGAKAITAGRFGQTFGATGFWSDAEASGGIDGIKFDFTDDKRITVGFANFGAAMEYPEYVTGGTSATYPNGDSATPYYFTKGIEDAFFLNAKFPISDKTDFYTMYLKEVGSARANALMTSNSTKPTEAEWSGGHELWGLGVKTEITDNVNLLGDFMQNRAFDDHQNAYYLSLRYKGADIEKPGSFGVNLDYRHIDAAYTRENNKGTEYYSILAGNKLSSDMTLAEDGIKGPVIGFQWAPGYDLLVEAKRSFATKYTETGEKADDYTSISLSTKF
ncbi:MULTISPECIES: hypothetical protein [Anaerosinus]|uniref:Porin n=1 Tax=Selenobaculum gibii TaxID=3054208 RepID=A0A9Y2AH88_9FIRM|nr:hypothetical protein [Selenobaculum gbiensis]WIW70779.1 hypothetical protein P3F81_00145 [Selenobaculum gbiensis]